MFNLKHPTVLYALAGSVGGFLLGALVLASYELLHLLPEPTASNERLPGAHRIALAYLGGGMVGGAIWGSLRPLTHRLWGAVLAGFLAALPLFSLLSLAVGNPNVGGILIRSLAVAVLTGAGWFAVRVRLIGRASDQVPSAASGGTSGGRSNGVAESRRAM